MRAGNIEFQLDVYINKDGVKRFMDAIRPAAKKTMDLAVSEAMKNVERKFLKKGKAA